MGLKEALAIYYKITLSKNPPHSYVEYSNYYVFFVNSDKTFDGVVAIDKKKKKPVPYRPNLIPIDEYRSPVRKGLIDV